MKRGGHHKVEPRLSKVDYQVAIRKMFAEAGGAGQAHLGVHAGKLHTKVGGYPGPGHSMPSCCDVMYAEMKHGDEVLEAPPKKRGANVVIRYRLPRTNRN
ncbi:HNH endonuclease [Janthinobacterium sp. BJB412]|nr:HNH endonuclease [Janthinobacterium sp. BJB412]